jgi:hypothetical protein
MFTGLFEFRHSSQVFDVDSANFLVRSDRKKEESQVERTEAEQEKVELEFAVAQLLKKASPPPASTNQ